ncbi:hypothetical protein [uncultured Maricaulis sp.]|uniref:hypothetical protein n=1 Tax=uncultured Maricaulis sp. TaxID=174710 RepID=UPI00262E0891|nr:hypothetical protein [uncultured Maricaulis sp.]
MSNTSVMSALALVSLVGASARAEMSGAEIVLPETDMSAILAASSTGLAFGQDTGAQLDLFFSSEYGYCDARKVAHVWNTDPFSAKAIIGGKIANGLTNLVDADIASTAGRVSCEWGELGLTWDQAVALADYWGRSPGEAKAKAGDIASDLGHKGFMRTMAHVLEPSHPQNPSGNDAAYQQMFFNSDYGYCDALKVAHVWGTDVGSAKTVIGQKIAGGITDLVDADIASTATSVQCSWVDTELDFDDALTLADFWGVPVGEAKMKATAYTSEWGNRGFRDRLGSVLARG